MAHSSPTPDNDPLAIPFVHHFVGGVRHLTDVERWASVTDPSTGAQRAAVPLGSDADADDAVQDAHRTLRDWSAWPPLERSRVMSRFKALIAAHLDELARLIATEHGKVLLDARGEVQRGLEVVASCGDLPHLMTREASASLAPGIDAHARRQPLGVAVAITPFNFPVMLPLQLLAPAIAGGCTCVLKPSAKVPSAPVRLAELFIEAGAPPGVLNVLHGDHEAVEALITHPLVSAVSYVGSTPIAHRIGATARAHGKRVHAMGATKHHHVVMPDADLARVTEVLVRTAYGSAGARGMAIAVAVPVGQATADALVARMAERVRALRIGPSLADGMEMGPLVSEGEHARLTRYVEVGVADGASLVVDGRDFRPGDAAHANGSFMGGSLFDHVTAAMRLYQEAIVGPLLCVVRAASLEEALGMADRHATGAGVSIHTRDGEAAQD